MRPCLAATCLVSSQELASAGSVSQWQRASSTPVPAGVEVYPCVRAVSPWPPDAGRPRVLISLSTAGRRLLVSPSGGDCSEIHVSMDGDVDVALIHYKKK